MRSPQYQLDILDKIIDRWIEKVQHSIRALRDDEKRGKEWTYLHLVNLQDDMDYLGKFIAQRMVVQLMRDADETDIGPVVESEYTADSKSAP